MREEKKCVFVINVVAITILIVGRQNNINFTTYKYYVTTTTIDIHSSIFNLQSLSGVTPVTLLELRFPAYDHAFSDSPNTPFSLVPLLYSSGALLGLLDAILREGVANGEPYGELCAEKGF